MKTLRGVGVGAGYFSRFHYEAWRRIPGVDIVALANREPEEGRRVAEEFGIPCVYSWRDIDRMLQCEQPDFIDIVTPPETHLPLVQLAAARGIAVICQKPLAPTMEQSREIVATAQRAGIRFMVHENWRWQPWYREIKRRLDGGALGELFAISVCMRLGDGWRTDAYVDRQPFFRNYPRLLIYETGIHFLDTFRYLGGEIGSVYARLQRRNPGILGEDAGQVVCGFHSGATALLDASRYNEADTDDPRYTFGTVRVEGSRGHIELGLDGTLRRKPLGQPAAEITYSHPRRGFAGDCVHAVQSHFVDRLRDGGPFESTGSDYLRSVALVEACYSSHASDQVVHIP